MCGLADNRLLYWSNFGNILEWRGILCPTTCKLKQIGMFMKCQIDGGHRCDMAHFTADASPDFIPRPIWLQSGGPDKLRNIRLSDAWISLDAVEALIWDARLPQQSESFAWGMRLITKHFSPSFYCYVAEVESCSKHWANSNIYKLLASWDSILSALRPVYWQLA